MLRVGLTGGIGAGKSTVARRLADLGAVVIDADALAREVVRPGTAGLTEVVETFGVAVLAPDGTLDRTALGGMVFSDPAARSRLEAITHPRIRALTETRFAAVPPGSIVVHDVPLLVELGYEGRYHLVVVVHADAQERVRRLVQDRGMSETAARGRLAAQAGDRQRKDAADIWLDNTSDRAGLGPRLTTLWTDRLQVFTQNIRQGRVATGSGDVVVVPADESWRATGGRLVARVRRAVGDRGMSVQHIGSTAVPGLAAKDVIDLQLEVPDLVVADALVPELTAAGFPPVRGVRADTPKPGQPGPWEKRLHGSADPARQVHLHVRVAGSPGARYAVSFRDWLRADSEAREQYALLKRQLAARHPTREAYAAAKEPWFSEVAWPRMLAWQGRSPAG